MDATIARTFEALDPGRDWAVVRAAMNVKCPWCKARPFQVCHSQGRPLAQGDRIHPSRAALAASQGPQ